MTSENIAFRRPNFDDNEHSNVPESVPHDPKCHHHDEIGGQLPADADNNTVAGKTHNVTDPGELDHVGMNSKSSDPTDKDALSSPTRSVAEGQMHKVVKKKTYLHRQSMSYPNRARKQHYFLVKILAVTQNIWTMVSTFPYWDMAFWSGFAYSIGSIMFIIDGAFAFGPLASPDRHWPEGEDKYAGPLLFFLGAVVFYQTGAVMAYLEAVNDGCFAGVAMKRFWEEGSEEDKKKLLDEKLHTFFGHIIPHHHRHDGDSGDVHEPDKEGFHEYITWRWWPTWTALRTYHMREVGYIACTIQLLGAVLYSVTGVVVLPGVLSSLAWWQKIAAFWVPQVVASCCFLTAGIMFTIETQEKWYIVTPWTVRWWIGGWATVGSVGFLLCACFGLGSHKYTWCEYQSDLSSTWGSVAYLFSSLLQWYESVSAGPVLA
ncbi:hypothetical protein P280DRAFT_423112, partial [Massarina eburnea CBS 473.64]